MTFPRILLQGEKYRFVEDQRVDASGVPERVHIIELLDGKDAMGSPRWVDVTKRDSNTGYQGAVLWLKQEFARRLASKE